MFGLPFCKKKITFALTFVVEQDEGGEFYAHCPALEGLHVGGLSKEEACQNAKDAAIAYLTSLIKHGEPIPLTVVNVEVEEPELPTFPAPSRCVHRIPVTV